MTETLTLDTDALASGPTQTGFDRARAEAFAERVGEAIDHAALAGMTALGHRLGLFDTLAGSPPATSREIAARAGLSERYVREWLSAMTTGEVVVYDPKARSFHLPEEHAACLTRNAPLGNLAVYTQHACMIAMMQDKIVGCFETGGGLSYDDYPRFHEIMHEDSDQTVTAALHDTVLPLVHGLAERLERGIEVLDAGCGRGGALLNLAAHFPASRFTGYEFCADAVAWAQRAAEKAGLENLRFEQRDLTGYDESDRWDLVFSFDAVHDQKDPQGLVSGIARSLKPGGVYVMQDIGGSAHLEQNMDFPMATMLYSVSCVHCTPVSIGQGGAGLGTMWGRETAEEMLHEAGFSEIDSHVFPHDPMNIWFISRR